MENLKNLMEQYKHYPKNQNQSKEIHKSTSGSHKMPKEYLHLLKEYHHLIKEYHNWTKEQTLQL